MISHFLTWLKSLYYTPVTTTETQSEETPMTDQIVDTAAQTAAAALVSAAAPATTVTVSALAEFKAKAEADIAKVVAFVEHGIELLGAEAEADLVALKAKYL